MYDARDRWLVAHHRRRLEAAAHCPIERQRQAAEKLLQVALRQGRIQLIFVARQWAASLG
jgi:hypothetical protein